jgi:hypothetical protein
VEIDEGLVERLAQLIHGRYLSRQRRRTRARKALPAWSELDEGLRNASRDQARDIAAKLGRIGCSVEPGAPGSTFTFGPDELDLLARAEHVRWVRERTAAGWIPGPDRDDSRKIHPSLVGWDALAEAERDKDRDAVRDIPVVLAAAGLHVARTTPSARPSRG